MTRSFSHLWTWTVVIVLLLVGALPPGVAVAQQGSPAGGPPGAVGPAVGPTGAVQDANGLWYIEADRDAERSTVPATSGGPDDYGYVWEDSANLNWVEATNGTDTGMSGDSWDQRTGAIPLPFAFKYYDATFSSAYIGASGYIALQDSPSWYWSTQVRVPVPSVPNTVISPFSTPLTLATGGSSGRVFYRSGGTAPNRYFVVVWNDVRYAGEDERYTFGVILYEDGNIIFQYKAMTWGDDSRYYCGYVGIEDAEGLDGFGYEPNRCVPNQIWSSTVKTIRITRPAPTARVKVTPHGQGRFSHANSTESFEVNVYNNGELGADTYNLSVSSPWPAVIQMGGQPLVDTNGDAQPDTGALAQGERKKITVQVQTPTFANVADTNTATLNVRSTRNPGWVRSTLLRTTIPTPFAQIYSDLANPGIRMIQPNPDGQIDRRVTTSISYGTDMAVAGTPSGGYAALWSEWMDGARHLRYARLDSQGALQSPIQELGTVQSGWFSYLAVAVAPNGYIGHSWAQVQSRQVNGVWEYNYNVFLAILDGAGNIVLTPTNLTGNVLWGNNTVNVPEFSYSQITATRDNRFAVAWQQDVQTTDSWEADLFFTVRSADGQVVKPVTQFSQDPNTNQHNAMYPRLAVLNGNRFLLAYRSWSTAGVRLAVFDGAGNRVIGPVSVSDDYGSPSAAAQLSSGSILVVWEVWSVERQGLRYAMFDSATLNALTGPFDLVNPFSFTGDAAPSIAVDAANRAVITWSEDYGSYRPTHFYTLLDGNGSVLVPSTPWLPARVPVNGRAPVVASSQYGYGVAPNYSFAPTSNTQADVQVSAPTLSAGAPDGNAQIDVNVGNMGLPTASSVVVTAELDPQLIFAGANPPPNGGGMAAASGGVYTWNVPNLAYLSQGKIVINTGVPSATIGTRYPVTITVSSSGSDANPANNTFVAEVMVAEQVFLPMTNRGED